MADKTFMNIHIAPNRPLYVALANPSGDSEHYDFDLQMGRYQTTDGQILALPRAAVVKLNALAPRPEEEIQITKIWSGKPGDTPEWSICLSTRSENARAMAEAEGQDLTAALQTSIEASERRKAAVDAPTPISTRKKEPKPSEQPRLFEQQRGNGTTGAAVLPAPYIPPAVARSRSRVDQIPANIAVREILAFIHADPNTANWSDQARQDLASTVYIASVKQGLIGVWERGQ